MHAQLPLQCWNYTTGTVLLGGDQYSYMYVLYIILYMYMYINMKYMYNVDVTYLPSKFS